MTTNCRCEEVLEELKNERTIIILDILELRDELDIINEIIGVLEDD